MLAQNSSYVLASILSKPIVGFLSSTLIFFGGGGVGAVGGGLKMLGMVLSMIFSLSLTRDGRTHSKVYLLPKKKERKKENTSLDWKIGALSKPSVNHFCVYLRCYKIKFGLFI